MKMCPVYQIVSASSWNPYKPDPGVALPRPANPNFVTFLVAKKKKILFSE
jgi:hypothetical protein